MSEKRSCRGTHSGRRFSSCAEAARAAELERIRAMSPGQRMALALALGRRQAVLERLHAEATDDEV